MVQFFSVKLEEKGVRGLKCTVKDFIKIKNSPFILEEKIKITGDFKCNHPKKIFSSDEILFSDEIYRNGILVHVPSFFLNSTGKTLTNGIENFVFMLNGDTLVVDSPSGKNYYFIAVDDCLKRFLIVD